MTVSRAERWQFFQTDGMAWFSFPVHHWHQCVFSDFAKKCVNSTCYKTWTCNKWINMIINRIISSKILKVTQDSCRCLWRDHWKSQWFWWDHCNDLRDNLHHWMFFWYSDHWNQWFLGCLTIDFNGFQSLGTIGQMMEWFRWIVQV